MASRDKTLLFIPDISGFTSFVRQTEIDHSRHIISELLELIINSDKYGMTVSEVEGDAILFYKNGPLSLNELIDQCETTFLNFHIHLQKYESERICRCGACETAAGLSLKFIAHVGTAKIIHIKDHQKLHGADVILAHKLLKNSIPQKEYILLSGNMTEDTSLKVDNEYSWVELHKAEDHYEDLGKIFYDYIPMNKFPIGNVESKNINFPELGAKKITVERTINAPVDVVYEYYTDFDKRVEWNEDVRQIILKDGKLTKSGSIHACLVGSNTLDIESIGRIEENETIIYGERLNKFKGLRDIINIFTFEKRGEETILKIELDYKVSSWVSKLLKPVIHRMLRKQTEISLNKLKSISETVKK